ncbi:hypothetical protein CEUSTIGMA_g2729.t1 [Chlamydomonas eustigma]|uniref:GPN-loop GTPase n=1 Tax=Chlamydomonas eustigma TaxID=1157962 RepID=A0A250WWS4_9CHLO|nr:hypothetical protein CEUSTIGMA_g2729.t1 [Chlamydomonas eustigma]|eukprot:GAX75284.1 hypothetical protein CEUSTIGMA_g2729.t1 [Chlamydomonas eustigma]
MEDNQASTSEPSLSPKPIAVLVIGMAGSGKTTLIQQINSYMHAKRKIGYIINLDPAVTHMPYEANIDIRDTVKYKNVMKEYNLGPNGGILTSCNMFATRFDQVIKLCEKPRDPALQYIIADTPGQIEIFTWSASGAIITELLASSFPTLVVYVVDTPRCTNPQTFMSNMLQACSILYKTKLPMLLAFNKVDVTRHDFAIEWMTDFESYQAALDKDPSYASTLSRSLSLVLDEFYNGLKSVGVSAVTGEGMAEFFEGIEACAEYYEKIYVPEMQQLRKEKEERETARKQREMQKLQKDLIKKAQLADPITTAGACPSSKQLKEAEGVEGGLPTPSSASVSAAIRPLTEEGDEGDEGSCDYEIEDEDIEQGEEEAEGGR